MHGDRRAMRNVSPRDWLRAEWPIYGVFFHLGIRLAKLQWCSSALGGFEKSAVIGEVTERLFYSAAQVLFFSNVLSHNLGLQLSFLYGIPNTDELIDEGLGVN